MVYLAQGFPGSSNGKASAWNSGDPGSNPGLGKSSGADPLAWTIPWMEEPGRLQWGHKELDMTERLHFLYFTILST